MEDALGFIKGPGGVLINMREFQELCKHGCSYCQGDLVLEHPNSIVWLDSRTPLCADCGSMRAVGDI